MPYIDDDGRYYLDMHNRFSARDVGELNYIITTIIHDYINQGGLRYYSINEVIGVLECAKLELYRQIAAPYEDKKKEENGNISELDK